MISSSIWIDKEPAPSFPELTEDKEVDVAIIGGGVTGVTTAQLLSERGFKVAILEAGRIAQSNTGRSTGNLYVMIDTLLSDLLKKYSYDDLRRVFDSRFKAKNLIEENIEKFNIECDYHEVDWIRFSMTADMDNLIYDEFEIFKEIGFAPKILRSTDDRISCLGGRVGVKISGQAQFNPYLYVTQLAQKISSDCLIFENSSVNDFHRENNQWIIKTNQGRVYCKYLIEGTHTPIGFSLIQTLLAPYREYAFASACEEQFESGIYWGHLKKDEVISVRNYFQDNKQFILFVGGDYKVGQGNGVDSLKKIKDVAGKLGLHTDKGLQWGGQHYRSADLLPYIGQKDGRDSYVATGFSTNGLIYGTLAAQLISDEIFGVDNDFSQLYSPKRVTPVKSMKNFIFENANVVKQYVVDYLREQNNENISPGEGKIIDIKGNKIAACKNADGELFVCSAVCPHLGCVVHWNKAESSWDCPCHGSRFQIDGEVIEGPSLHSLDKLEGD